MPGVFMVASRPGKVYNRKRIQIPLRRFDDLKRLRSPARTAMILLLAAICALPGGCTAPAPREDAARKADVQVLLDGAAWDGQPVSPGAEGLRVYVTLDGAALIDVPFAEVHTLDIIQPDGAENAIRLTGDAVFMERANCQNQDCVQMGEVTEDNLELRVLGGFIVCLPHRLSVEVRGD